MGRLRAWSSCENRLGRQAVVAVVLLMMAGLAAWMINDLRSSYRQTLDSTRKEMESLSAVIESNVLTTIAKIDVVLGETAYSFTPVMTNLGSRDLKKANHGLLRLMAYIPEVQKDSLRVIDAEGRVVFNAGLTAELPKVIVEDRAYFQRQKHDPDAGLVVSEPLLSRFTGRWLITLSRRMTGPDGQFLGLVQAALRTEFFQGLFELVQPGPYDSITLFDNSMRLLGRLPAMPDQLGRQFYLPRMSAEIAAGRTQGGFLAMSVVDDLERLFVYRKLADFPYTLSIGRAPGKFLAEWRHKAYLYGLGYFGLAMALTVFLILSMRHQRAIEKLASIDGLTGLTNRRVFDITLDFAINIRARARRPLAIILFDIDHFKRINDTRGHIKGDEVLRRVVDVITRNLRKADLPCRWGGEEFIVLLDGCDLDHACEIAEDIRLAVEAEPMSDPDDGLRVTISAGIAEVVDEDSVTSVVTRADQALYQAKEDGRNRIHVAGFP